MTIRKRALALGDGRAGIDNQSIGLAEAVATLVPLDVEFRAVSLPDPVRRLPTALAPSEAALSHLRNICGDFSPDLIIGSGRQAALAVIAARRLSPRPFRVQTQSPRAPVDRFDLVIPPEHDGLSGPNVFPILGAPGRLTRERVTAAAAALPPAWRRPAERRLAVLIGGPNRGFAFAEDDVARLADAIGRLALEGWIIAASTSRRTPAHVAPAIRAALPEGAHCVHDASCDQSAAEPTKVGARANPYPGLLGVADAVLVTVDSVSMASEAASAGTPTYIFPLTPRRFGAGKFLRFQRALVARGVARDFLGVATPWDLAPFDETTRAAVEIVARWRHHESWRD
ncbi:MAG: hypothetical protein GC152_09610 [Alphaproteobacteria bacterium]|nr:hypothetical protein [Alphaproteobacteria bacterium]